MKKIKLSRKQLRAKEPQNLDFERAYCIFGCCRAPGALHLSLLRRPERKKERYQNEVGKVVASGWKYCCSVKLDTLAGLFRGFKQNILSKGGEFMGEI